MDTPPSTIFRVDTSWPLPREGQPLLQCYGPPGNSVHLGEATGNRTDLFFLVDFGKQVANANRIGESFGADIYHAFNRAKTDDTTSEATILVDPDTSTLASTAQQLAQMLVLSSHHTDVTIILQEGFHVVPPDRSLQVDHCPRLSLTGAVFRNK